MYSFNISLQRFVDKMFKYLSISYKKNSGEKKLEEEELCCNYISHKIDRYHDYIILDKENKSIIVEVKSYRNENVNDIYNAIDQLKKYRRYMDFFSLSPYSMLIVFNKVTIELRKKMQEENIILIDISNILYLIKDNEELIEELNEILSYSRINIIPEEIYLEEYLYLKAPVRYKVKNRMTKEDELINRILNLEKGKAASAEFEKIGEDIIKLIFGEYLYGWKKQRKSAKGMYRFDLIAKIKEQKGFWRMIHNFFKTQYVVFEFKNYSEAITQEQIYTTEKYLYQKALRNVAIIVTRKGLSSSAERACAGSLREQGKLILALDQEKIIKLLELKKDISNKSACSEYLEEIFDDFLMDLEK